jgi:serine/alanine adding enzyme
MPHHVIRYAADSDRERWDAYVLKHPDASLFHLYGWRDVFHRTYGHATYYLMVLDDAARDVLGVLPLVHFKHPLFGNRLVSLPFVDGGGALASSRVAEEGLLAEAVRLGRQMGAGTIELRQERRLACAGNMSADRNEDPGNPLEIATRTDKVRMLLSLPESSGLLLESFKSKLRSQINRPLKEGFTSRIGGMELLDDFYRVFLVNMRDLGSPVHSVELMRQVLGAFPEHSRIIVVCRSEEPVASALVVGFDKVLRNPWSSSLRKYASSSPNMLLYLRMLEYACDAGCRIFDFGRSTAGESAYRFKEQWGALPAPLYWYYLSLDGKSVKPENSGTERFRKATHYWKKLPLVVTRIVGPRIRKYISL